MHNSDSEAAAGNYILVLRLPPTMLEAQIIWRENQASKKTPTYTS